MSIISALLSISTAEGIRGILTDHSPRPSVGLSLGLSVCPVGDLWKNGWVYPDAVCGGEWVGRVMGVLDGVVIV